MRPRILCYAVNGLGLGHLTRLLAIARRLRVQSPGAEILFLTSNEAAAYCYREGFAAFKVPSHSARAVGGISAGRHAKLVQSVTWSLVAAFDPNLLIVDSFPAGAVQELLPILRWDMRRVFVFREQQHFAANDPYFQSLLGSYHLILVPHASGEVMLPLPLGVPVQATGPILLRDRDDALPRAEARQRLLGVDDHRLLCYVNFGGGGDRQVVDALELTLAALANYPDIHSVIAPGPLADGDWEPPAGATVVHRYPIAPYFAAMDMAIAAAGYNTHAELLHFGVPTAFVPFAKGLDDQPARVARTVERGAALAVLRLAAPDLDGPIAQLRDPASRARLRQAAQREVPTNGAAAAAAAILALLN